MADNSGKNWAAFGQGLTNVGQAFNNAMGGGELNQTMQQYQAMPAQVSEAKAKGQKQEASTDPMVLAMQDPVKFANAQILMNILPMMVQHASEAYQTTGQVPNAATAFSPDQMAALGAITGQVQKNQPTTQAQPQEVAPTKQPMQPGAMPDNSFEQQARSVAQPTSILGKILTALPMGQLYQQHQLDNISKAQEIAGEQPMQKGETTKAALEVTKEVAKAEKVPLTQAQRAVAQAAVTTATTEKENKAIGRIDDAIKSLEEHRKEIWDKSNFLGKGAKIKHIDTQLEKLRAVQAAYTQKTLERDIPNPAEGKGAKFSEEDIQHTLKLHPEYTREQLLKTLGK